MFEKITRALHKAFAVLSDKRAGITVTDAVQNLKQQPAGTKYLLECTPEEAEQINMMLADIREQRKDLSELTPEERKKIFAAWSYPRALDFELDLGNTVFHVNARFDERTDEDVVSMVNRVIETKS